MEISTPGRVCLFGEHQDYLGLPVLAMAISLRSFIKSTPRNDSQVIIRKPDIGETEKFDLNNIKYSSSKDHFKSGLKVCKRFGFKFSKGFECDLRSNIPIKAGTSSSSSILVTWIHFLSQIADNAKKLDRNTIAELAYQTEVIEFNSPGDVLIVGNHVWHGFKDMSEDAILLAVSSTNYSPDRSDYCEEYSEYQKIVEILTTK